MFRGKDIDYYMKKAFKNFKKGNFTKAKDYYIKALSIDSTNLTALNNLSQIYKVLGDNQTSLGYCELVVEECDRQLKNGKSENLLFTKSQALISLNKTDEADRTISELLEMNPDNLIALYLKLEHLNRINDSGESLKYIDKILKSNPYDTNMLLLKTKTLLELKDFDRADECLKLIFQIDSKNITAFNLKSTLIKMKYKLTLTSHDFAVMAIESWNNNHIDAALRYMEQSLSLCSKSCELWFLQGELFIRSGRIGDAIDSFKKAFEINPESGGIKNRKKFFKMLNRMKKVNRVLGYEK